MIAKIAYLWYTGEGDPRRVCENALHQKQDPMRSRIWKKLLKI
jgi:hypothetical protein